MPKDKIEININKDGTATITKGKNSFLGRAIEKKGKVTIQGREFNLKEKEREPEEEAKPKDVKNPIRNPFHLGR